MSSGSVESGLRHGRCQLLEHRGERLGVDRDLRQERPELLVVGAGHRRQWVERGEDEGLLLGLEVDVQHRDGRLAVRQRDLDAEVAVDQMAGAPVHDDLGHEADAPEQIAERRLLGLRVGSPVARVGEELVRRHVLVPDDPVGPGVMSPKAGR